MSVIRRVSVPAGQTVKVVPPDGRDHAGRWQWAVINPTGSGGAVELVDDPGKTIGGGYSMAAGATPYQTLATGDSIYAAGPASGSAVSIVVLGTEAD